MKKTPLLRIPLLLTSASLSVLILSQTTNELDTQAKTAYDAKQYGKSAELYVRAFKKGKLKNALFNAACSFAMAGQKKEALNALEWAAREGYNEVKPIQTDADLASLRTEPGWAKIVAQVEKNAIENPPPKPWTRTFTVLDPFAADRYEAKLRDGDSAVWQDGETLTFALRSKATSVRLNGGIQEAMKKVEGTDIWALDLKIPGGWDRAFTTYSFIESPPNPKSMVMKVWSGPAAPKLPEAVSKLQGTINRRKVHSKALGEDRDIIVYVPAGSSTRAIPAVFLADGGACEEFAKVLEPLILSKRVLPCAIVGIENGKYTGKLEDGYDPMKDNRAREYVPGLDPDRFQQHMDFFTKEVGAYVTKEFGISNRREDLAVTGFSNGGAFSAAVAFRMPNFFGVSMPLSLGVPPSDGRPKGKLPRMYFSGGHLESFGASTNALYKRVKAWGVECSFDEYMAGHDFEMWKLAFTRSMPKAFPPR